MSNKSQVVGLVVILIIAGLFVLGWAFAANNASGPSAADLQEKLATVVDGVQRAKLTAIDSGYLEREIVLKQGVPAELTIFGQTAGCANAVTARDFWQGVKIVQKGEVEKVSFTPMQTGKFKGACTMGMYTFNIFVV
jgi:plastocyanin domain-containing protein